jgi:phytoene dehydrogenase-like protein
MSVYYDAVITGSGPNGLAAAVFLQQKGLKTAIYEQSDSPGGGAKTLEITLPGFKHDIASAIHPLCFDSPFLKTLPLQDYGLAWVHPDIPYAHPFTDGSAYACYRSIEETAAQLGSDEKKYINLFNRLVNDWPHITKNILGPLSFPKHPVKMARFGLKALMPAKYFVRSNFSEEKSRLLFYGAAAHSTLPLNSLATASFGLVLNILGHKAGWPFPEGGAGKITEALAGYYRHLGGEIILNHRVKDIGELPKASVYLFDITPRQLLEIQGTRFSHSYRQRLSRFKYGAGVFKIDWALSDPIPFRSAVCRRAGTVHLGFSAEEIEHSEAAIHRGGTVDSPYVLLAQHSVFDKTRVPSGKHTGWAYCHVPHGSTTDMTAAIENQVEKAAPGFKDCILHRTTHNTSRLEAVNPNLVGGDINGGKQDITQLFTRPVARISPYSTPDPRVYICSSSTPPGGGVHGMCGYNAALRVWKDHFEGK